MDVVVVLGLVLFGAIISELTGKKKPPSFEKNLGEAIGKGYSAQNMELKINLEKKSDQSSKSDAQN